MMLQIGETVVALDIVEDMFCCDLAACKGWCCVDGESGAPLEKGEVGELEKVLPLVWDDLSPEARAVIDRQGVAYRDTDGDMVTSIVNGQDCVFTYHDEEGVCRCAVEKAFREGRSSFYKPISCHLYPIRLHKYRDFTAVNYHRWSICQPAVACGNARGVRVYQFLQEPLVRRFGQQWYDELSATAEEYLKCK